MKIEFTQTAYVTGDYELRHLVNALAKGDTALAGRAISPAVTDMTSHGWIKVGVAHITVDLLDPKDMQGEQLAALQAQLQKERADSQMRQNAILEQISKLQALEWEGGAA